MTDAELISQVRAIHTLVMSTQGGAGTLVREPHIGALLRAVDERDELLHLKSALLPSAARDHERLEKENAEAREIIAELRLRVAELERIRDEYRSTCNALRKRVAELEEDLDRM